MRILFMGTPDFAVNSFQALCDHFDVIGAVTQPDKPKGRGYALTPPPVKKAALEMGIPVFQPETLRDEAFLPTLRELSPDLIAVVAYGKILPSYILNFPRYGCVNLHGSLLPKYRGAAPMQRAILEGQTETGVTTMLMAKGLDTGDMLEKSVLPIGINDNFETVHDGLSRIGANLLVSTVEKLEKGGLTPIPQDDSLSSYAAKIEKADCRINFCQNALAVHNQIRALSPIPLAFTDHAGKMLKIVSSTLLAPDGTFGTPGAVYSLANGNIAVACQTGAIAITGLLPEGKGKMSAKDFINGRRIQVGDILGQS